jgi:hypothetical protein
MKEPLLELICCPERLPKGAHILPEATRISTSANEPVVHGSFAPPAVFVTTPRCGYSGVL